MDNEIEKTDLFTNVVQIIEQAKGSVASAVNTGMTLMYWNIGKAINDEVLKGQRAEYGKQVVENLSEKLRAKYGDKEFSPRSLRRMMQFSQEISLEIVSPLVTKLSWTHFLLVLPLKDKVQREFYLTMASCEKWTKRELQERIDSMLYERTLISKESEDFIKQELASLRTENKMNPDLVFKSPYFFDFTGLSGFYSEHDLEEQLLSHLQSFLLEMGKGFAFVDRQKRMIIDGDDFHLDLLFYHRKLKRLIAVDLKLGRFKAEYKGQMELYLRYLDKYEKEDGEESPLGLLLCTEGSDEQIELLQLEQSGIKVCQYLTELPDKELLVAELKKQKELIENNILIDTKTQEN